MYVSTVRHEFIPQPYIAGDKYMMYVVHAISTNITPEDMFTLHFSFIVLPHAI